MKALLRGGSGVLALLLASSISHGYVLVSPVFKQTYPRAPDLYNSAGYYYYDACGQLHGPCYYLVPPCQPFGGMLPGPTGQAIMSGNLPHTLLLSKEGLAIGNVPLVGQKQSQGEQPQYGPQQGGPPGPNMMGGPASQPYPSPSMQAPYARLPGPYPMQAPYGPMPNPYPMQAPYGPMVSPYGQPVPMPIPYPQAMPQPMPMPLQYPAPYGTAPMPYPQQMPYPQPMPYPQQAPARMPSAYYYPASMPNYAQYYQMNAAIAQAQNTAPQPFMPIPGFGPPPAPTAPRPPVPGTDPGNGFNYYTPMQPLQPFGQLNPMQPMTPPAMQMQPMQLPRMDYIPPPAPKVGGAAYPTHPFVRSPRDFFMWGENMEDEQQMRKRAFPLP